ncbi:MAG: hypothetical protein IT425_10575 [Pirellulales bacterium]|nr:hypothetical protein [Pirellulales bacterium]
MHAKFEIEWDNTTTDAIVLRDLDGPRSITNDAEAVVAELYGRGLLGSPRLIGSHHRRVLYYDTQGNLDELKHDGRGRFTGFAPGPLRRQPVRMA